MLNTVAAQAVVFARIVKANLPIRGTLLFCAVSDEEAGGVDGAGFLTKDPTLQKVFHADYALTEFGGATLTDRYKQPTKTYLQANAEKGLATVEIRCKGTPGHGSMPMGGDNALAKASGVVTALSNYWAPTVVTKQWASMVSKMDVPKILAVFLQSSWVLAFVIRLLLYLKHPLGPGAHALTRMTMSPNHVKGTLKSNVVPGVAIVEVDVRLLPGQDEGYIREHINKALGARRLASRDYDITIRDYFPATMSPVDTPMWKAMEAAATALVPGCSFAQLLITGATDSRYFRHHCGTVAYGTSLFDPSLDFSKLTSCIHGNNEHLSLSSLLMSVQYFALTISNMMCHRGK